MAIRMKDIAAELGVSVMTVSKVLRNEGRISAATRSRILARVKELGYRPNLTARGLVSGRSYLVGLVVPDLTRPFFAAMAKFISRKLRAKGYALAISYSEEDPEVECCEIATFMARGVDALILASCQRSSSAAIFKQLKAEGLPCVLADRLIPGLKAHFVGSDDVAIGAMATEHLIERGYRRIGHIRGPDMSTGASRFQGYRETLRRHGYTAPEEFVVTTESADDRGEQCGVEAMQRLLILKHRPDAVFCYNDILAYGALKAILETGLRVPNDIALIGVSNLASLVFWDASPVALTTIDQGIMQLADLIANLILELLEQGPRPQPERVLVRPTLVVRGST